MRFIACVSAIHHTQLRLFGLFPAKIVIVYYKSLYLNCTMSDAVWLNAFAINEKTWLATDTNDSDKQNAWRTQKLLLAHATR